MTGNQSLSKQENSRISNDDAGLLISLLHMHGYDQGLPPEQVDRITAALTAAAHRPAEDVVPGWEPDVPLASDETFTFGAGAETITVQLPILGGDYYWSILLPRLEEWVSALYRGQALALLTQAALNPFPFMLDIFGQLARRPQADRLKVSFYETAALTFSRPETPITPQFFAKCPPDQQLGAIRKLVEINQANFTGLWAEMPTQLQYLITSVRTASMLSIEKLNGQLLEYISAMTMEASAALPSSGGHADTGIAGSGAWPEAGQMLTSPFEP